MTRSKGPYKVDNPWVRIGWLTASGLVTVAVILGFAVLGREQQNGPPLSPWAAICRGLGLTSSTRAADEPQPPLRTPTRIAWTHDTFSQINRGNIERGEFVAINCTACHGENGVSLSGLYPNLAGMKAEFIYKQLDDFRAGKRMWGVMNGIAQALSSDASADVAAYFANRTKANDSHTEHNPGEHDAARRLVYIGDPARGIAACSVCHGPNGYKLGAPALQGQQPDYIERQLAGFAQGMRENDINRQMRTIARQLKPEEMRAIAEFYGSGADTELAKR
jgi:cytochrome c553